MVFFGMGLACLFAGAGLAIFGGERQTLARLALDAPIRTVEQVGRLDGTAWVKARIEAATPANVLSVGGEKGAWLFEETFRLVLDDIRQGGKWKQRPRVSRLVTARREVPVVLQDGAATLAIPDWQGIEVGKDLLRRYGDSALLQEWLATDTFLATDVREIIITSYVPLGCDVWALGDFRGGRPQLLSDGAFYLTSLGPEGFARANEKSSSLGARLTWVLLALGVLFCFLGFRSLSRWRKDSLRDAGSPSA